MLITQVIARQGIGAAATHIAMGVSMRVTQAVCRIRMSRIRLLRRRCCMALMTLMPLMPFMPLMALLRCGWVFMCRLMLSWRHVMPMMAVVRVLC